MSYVKNIQHIKSDYLEVNCLKMPFLFICFFRACFSLRDLYPKMLRNNSFTSFWQHFGSKLYQKLYFTLKHQELVTFLSYGYLRRFFRRQWNIYAIKNLGEKNKRMLIFFPKRLISLRYIAKNMFNVERKNPNKWLFNIID